MAKLYYYNGEWKTYQYLHDELGYNTTATNLVTYKSVGYHSLHWGDSDGFGYRLNTNVSTEIEYFKEGNSGWYNLNQLALTRKVYPANASVCLMKHGTTESDAVMLEFSDKTLVLIAAEKTSGWKTLTEWGDSGWYLAQDFIIIDSNGQIIKSAAYDGILSFATTYHTIEDAADLIFVEQSQFPVISIHSPIMSTISVANNASFDCGLPYYASKLYIIMTDADANRDFTFYGWQPINTGNELYAKNTTGGTLNVTEYTVYYIDAANAEVVTVKDANDNLYNAFKYTLSGTAYYYVIDGTHNTWTDDLSSWGYSEVQPVVLPTVYLLRNSSNEWGYTNSSLSDTALQIANDGTADLYYVANSLMYMYDGALYALEVYQSTSGTDTARTGIEFVMKSSSHSIQCKNVSGGSISVTRMRVHYLFEPSATIVSVYDSSNVAYNAFKYTTNNVDYYYVLDGTQTAWTDDLASIGYKLSYTAYRISNKSPAVVNNYTGFSPLYDENAHTIAADSTKNL